MGCNLEIKTGPLAGKIIPVSEGRPITVGRTRRSGFAIPHDTFLSGVHFRLECNGLTCRVVDQKSANGTFLNGTRVAEAIVHDGDEITAGKTSFTVRMVEAIEVKAVPSATGAMAASPAGVSASSLQPSLGRAPAAPPRAGPALTIGSWSFGKIPEGWVVDEGYGMHFSGPGSFSSEVVASEEPLAAGVTLQTHLESQAALVRELVLEPEVKIIGPMRVAGADEAMAVVIRYKTGDGRRFVQRQLYARSGQSAGVLTLTAPEDELPRVQSVFEAIISAARFEGKSGDC